VKVYRESLTNGCMYERAAGVRLSHMLHSTSARADLGMSLQEGPDDIRIPRLHTAKRLWIQRRACRFQGRDRHRTSRTSSGVLERRVVEWRLESIWRLGPSARCDDHPEQASEGATSLPHPDVILRRALEHHLVSRPWPVLLFSFSLITNACISRLHI
jgi:hypothetical protein